MGEKIKVISTSMSGVTINLSQFNQKVIPVAPMGFAYLNDDEYAYLTNTSKIFEHGSLKIEGDLPEGLEKIESPNALSDADILDILKKPLGQITLALEDITNIEVVKRILTIATEQDKGVKLIDSIQARIEKIAG